MLNIIWQTWGLNEGMDEGFENSETLRSRIVVDKVVTRGIVSQLLATLYTLKDCIDRCPLTEWNESHGDYPFSQVVFHTLFDCDYHLSDSDEEFRTQPFHLGNAKVFHDYSGLEDFSPVRLYEKDFLVQYYEHCQLKTVSKIEGRTIAELSIPNSDIRKNMTRLERWMNIARHNQHHAAQLALTLQLLTGKETEWISWGYERD